MKNRKTLASIGAGAALVAAGAFAGTATAPTAHAGGGGEEVRISDSSPTRCQSRLVAAMNQKQAQGKRITNLHNCFKSVNNTWYGYFGYY